MDLLSLPSYRSFVFTKGPIWNKVQASFVHMIENYCIHLRPACPFPLNCSSSSPLLPPPYSEHTQVQDHCNWECYVHLGTNTGNVNAVLSFSGFTIEMCSTLTQTVFEIWTFRKKCVQLNAIPFQDSSVARKLMWLKIYLILFCQRCVCMEVLVPMCITFIHPINIY